MPTNIAAPEASAHAVLIDERGWVLIVQPSYKRRWHLPGGYVHVGETPTKAVARDVFEEIGIRPELRGPVAVSWAPHGGADRLLFTYAGRLTEKLRQAVRIDGAEIIGWTTLGPERLEERLHPRVAERIRTSIKVVGCGQMQYVEHASSS
jgi:8-oxo-dGTP diphosphatase